MSGNSTSDTEQIEVVLEDKQNHRETRFIEWESGETLRMMGVEITRREDYGRGTTTTGSEQ